MKPFVLLVMMLVFTSSHFLFNSDYNNRKELRRLFRDEIGFSKLRPRRRSLDNWLHKFVFFERDHTDV